MRNKQEKVFYIFNKNTGEVVHTINYFFDDTTTESGKNPSDETIFNFMKRHNKYKDLNLDIADHDIHEVDKTDDDVKNGRIHFFKKDQGVVSKRTSEEFEIIKQQRNSVLGNSITRGG